MLKHELLREDKIITAIYGFMAVPINLFEIRDLSIRGGVTCRKILQQLRKYKSRYKVKRLIYDSSVSDDLSRVTRAKSVKVQVPRVSRVAVQSYQKSLNPLYAPKSYTVTTFRDKSVRTAGFSLHSADRLL